jgi:hypothetical protein
MVSVPSPCAGSVQTDAEPVPVRGQVGALLRRGEQHASHLTDSRKQCDRSALTVGPTPDRKPKHTPAELENLELKVPDLPTRGVSSDLVAGP